MVTIGPLRIFRHKEFTVEEIKVDRPETEVARFDSARNTASAKMNQFYQEAVSRVGLDNASIFKVYQQMLTESEFVDSVRSMIRSQSINAESAISQAEKNFTQIYSAGADVYMQAHIGDVQEIARILLRTLRQKKAMFAGDEPCILYADDLTPSETIQMDTGKILGFVTKEGTPTSHTAILARALGVPAIVATGAEVDDSYDGKTAVIDGFSGTVYLDPTPGILAVMKEKQDQSIRLKDLLQQLKGLPSETADGHRVEVAANVSSASDLAAVLKTTPKASAFSAVNSFIWDGTPSPVKKNSLTSINWPSKPWPARGSSSVPWISAQTRKLPPSTSPKKKTPPWACGPSASA